MSKGDEQGWAKVGTARKSHYYRGGKSLCGRKDVPGDTRYEYEHQDPPENCGVCLWKRREEAKEVLRPTAEKWMERHYPQPACSFSGLPPTLDNKIAATRHSLRKWRGLRKVPAEGPPIPIDDESCALCAMRPPLSGQSFSRSCKECPLFEYLGRRRCADYGMPFTDFHKSLDPKPMIEALKATLEMLEKAKHATTNANKDGK